MNARSYQLIAKMVNGRPMKMRSIFMGLACLLLLSPLLYAEDLDQNDARRLFEAGKIQPLPVILQAAQKRHPGRVIEVELERKDGRVIYEVELFDHRGRIWEMVIDAATAKVLSSKREK